MVPLIVIVTVVVFFLVDLGLRTTMKRIDRARLKRQREAALDRGLRIDVADEALTLKRIEVDAPRSRILAVDDEPIVLDSFRKILVLDGYSVDTVESGSEALHLIERRDYDFVFTDLKMPGMDGLEVTRAVKHLRPDIDVIVITGYGTIESAVEAMQHGALDYVEKPFTEDELTASVGKWLVRRQDAIAEHQPPKIHLVTACSTESDSERVYNVPAGVFVSPAHVWLRIEMSGETRIGIDDFARKTLGRIDTVDLPPVGRRVRRGEPLFTVRQDRQRLTLPSPVTGEVAATNDELQRDAHVLQLNPFGRGWVCRLLPSRLAVDLERLRIGSAALDWYQDEVRRLGELASLTAVPVGTAAAGGTALAGEPDVQPDELWELFSRTFVRLESS